MMLRRILAVSAAVLVSSGVCLAQAPKGDSAYKKLDPTRLAETLGQLGMSELLEAAIALQKSSGGGSSPDDAMLLAQGKIDTANRAPEAATRDKIMDEAVALLRKVVEDTSKPASEEARLKNFQARLKLAETLGSIRPATQLMRLQYLQAVADDRKLVAACTVEPIKILDTLRMHIDGALMNYRQDRQIRMNYLAAMEMFLNRVQWTQAWMNTFRAMSLPPAEGDRKTLLKEAAELIKEFVRSDAEIRFPAALLQGIIHRELREYDKADEQFKKAQDAQALPETRMQASLEAARNRIEQGKFDLAQTAIEDFRKLAAEIFPGQELKAAVYHSLLLHHFYDARATAFKDSAEAVRDRAAAQKVLVDFAAKCDDAANLSAMLELIGWKYSDRADKALLGPLVLIGVARVEANKHTDAGDKAAGDLIAAAVAVNDASVAEARPLVLWEAGKLLYRLKRLDEAGSKFAELGDKFAEHKLAFDAAVFGVQGLEEAMDEAEKQGRSVEDLRPKYIAALQVVVGKWGKKPDIAPLYYTLAVQHVRAADAGQNRAANLAEAVKNFQLVQPGSTYFESRRRALDIRYELIRESAQAAKDQKPLADFVADVTAFTGEAAKAAANEPSKNIAAQLKLWSAVALFHSIQVRYELMEMKDALKDIQKLLDEYAGTSVIPDVKGWEITTLMMSPEATAVADGIAKAQKFHETNPAEAAEVLQVVVDRVRTRIDQLRKNTGSDTAELQRLQQAYLKFAEDIFNRKKADAKTPADELYAAQQMYASALYETGKLDESLKLWKECAQQEASRRQEQTKAIDAELSSLVTAVKAARAEIDRLRAQVEPAEIASQREEGESDEDYKLKLDELNRRGEYKEALRQFDKLKDSAAGFEKLLEKRKVPETMQGRMIKQSIDAVGNAPNGQVRMARLSELADRLSTGIAGVRKMLVAQLEMDAANLLGQARVYSAMKQYGEAIKFYSPLRGIDRKAFPDFYWQVQLEYFRCMLQNEGTTKETYKQLLIAIAAIRSEDPEMGGSKGEFNVILKALEEKSK